MYKAPNALGFRLNLKTIHDAEKAWDSCTLLPWLHIRFKALSKCCTIVYKVSADFPGCKIVELPS